MRNPLVWIGATVGSCAGWWLGSFVGLMTAFVVSVFGTALGVYLGRWAMDELVGGSRR